MTHLQNIKKYFSKEDFFCPHVLKKYTEAVMWSFLDPRLLETIVAVREILGRGMTINDGRTYTQRGLRCNMCQLVKAKAEPYLSAHVLGKGIDFDVTGMTAEQARQTIINNRERLPYPIRLEKNVNWVHLDVMNSSAEKVYQF